MEEPDDVVRPMCIWKITADAGRTVVHVSAPSLREAVVKARKLINDSDQRLGKIKCIAELDIVFDKE